jgi:hypothetical protein
VLRLAGAAGPLSGKGWPRKNATFSGSLFLSSWLGPAQFSPSSLRAVGQFIPAQHPDPLPPVGCSNGACWYNLPLTSVPKRGQVAKDSVEESPSLRSKQACDVFKECESGSYVAKHTPTLSPQVALVCAGESFSGATVRLARKAPADHIRQYTASLKERIACNILDSTKADRIGKVAVIDGAGEGFDFGVGDANKSRLT